MDETARKERITRLKKLLEERDVSVRRNKLDELRRTADDRESAKAYMRRASLLESLRTAAAVQ